MGKYSTLKQTLHQKNLWCEWQKQKNYQNLPNLLSVLCRSIRKYTAEGYEILSIHLTEKLSGTVNAARQAADMVEGNITVVDCDYTARGQAFQVLKAAEMAQSGDYSVEEIHAKINYIRDKTKLYIVVVTLDNLIKGGRVGRMQGFLGSLLNIKLIAKLTDGQLEEKPKSAATKKYYNIA